MSSHANAIRKERMSSARAKADHDAAEWLALRRATRSCRYCAVGLNVFNGVRDHRLPVCRGGDNSIGNLDYICWQCNTEKGTSTPDEWRYSGTVPRPFRPAPRLAREYARAVGR